MANTTSDRGWLMIMSLLLALANAARARRPVVKTIQISNGDIIDCVDIYKQPAFNHPLLKNHTIQMTTTETSSVLSDGINSSKQYADIMCQECKSCPEGTIPILRTMKNGTTDKKPPPDEDHERTETATAEMIKTRGHYGGVAADISVWKPVVPQGYYTSTKIGVGSQSGNVNLFAGWTVYPSEFGDSAPRSYLFWLVTDGNETQTCTNLDCPGYVHVHPSFVLGGQLPSSDPGGIMKIIHVRIHKNDHDRKWWVSYNHERIGYWTYDIIATINRHFKARTLIWEGRVTNQESGPEAQTQMGSGHFASEGFGHAAHFGTMKYIWRGHQYNAKNLQITMTLPNCYNLTEHHDTPNSSGPMVIYGGPGGSHCYET